MAETQFIWVVIFWVLLAVAMAVIGSFLNVIIYRGPSVWKLLPDDSVTRGSFVSPRSYCPHCKQQIPSWRLVPIVSYILQGGKCAACNEKISIRYPLVELAGVAVGITAFIHFGFTPQAIFATVFGWFLITLAVIDMETGYLPDWLTIPLLLLGLIANSFGFFAGIFDAMIGAAIGYIVFSGIGYAFKRYRGYDALGGGDAKLIAALGAWGGWASLPNTVLVASLATLTALLLARWRGKNINRKTEIPFGPGLCIAGYLVLLFSF